MLIRPAQSSDQADIWRILQPVIRAGETYALPRDMSEADALAYWLSADRKTFVAEDEGAIVGTYYLRANQMGGGAHVANCGYVTDAQATGRGIARRMCEHSLQQGLDLGFRAMQFNCVVSTNAGAVRLWHAMGFETVGRLPGAFSHPLHGFVDALVMFRAL
ncbi:MULTISPECIES: GNAT family N-acetyltransferase [unclassified Beijerinckia]|uniref:GNAT family N-acetyltransferase n=1 Tax=unclassified Beijerinckia TaxID=2638183 RepID=UPI000899BDD1|nr:MULTISPECIES: GNAT family N-acetyltransferase [unclassified Beijerinckia]MDH7794451.1 L-amino acid N-acyltransferase YncA [Beijerinckia sp. GAS462]SEB62679.1 L-amino acid N-acyltransferase YncA [Beijerinckia sp. 28-YEA-48]